MSEPTPSPREDGPRGRDPVAVLRVLEQFERAMHRRARAEIVARLGDLVGCRAPMGEQWLQLTQVGADLGELGLARQAIDLFVENQGGSAAALFRKASFLAHIGSFGEALALLRALPADVPDPYGYALRRGTAAVNVGEPGEARAWLEEALRHRPGSGSAWYALAQLVDFSREPEFAERLIAAVPLPSASPQERALCDYTLGRMHTDRADHAAAFAAVSRGAAGMKAVQPHDRARERRRAEEALRGHDKASLAAAAAQQSEPTDRTIFVMGLPRSGTTLLEQILTSHSAVADGAELNLLRLLEHDAGGASGAALQDYIGRAGAAPLARLWSHLLGERFPAPGRIVDKTTDNSFRLGIAASVLPEAPLIWIRRDPLDCAWSCFRTCFIGGLGWSYDLADIAARFALEDQLLAGWRRQLGDRLLVVPFEELVGDSEAWIRRIVAHCGLAAEPAVFAPHENRRAVTTVSAMQVRRPISPASIGSSEPYRAFMKPFIYAYGA